MIRSLEMKALLCFSIVLISGHTFRGFVNAQEKELEGTLLTPEQTVAAAHLGISTDGYWHIFSRANPKAKPQLYEILADKDNERLFSNVLLMLGYVGDKSDVKRLEEFIRSYGGKELTGLERASVVESLKSLGLLARRGVDGASLLLQEMLKAAYWNQIDMQWYGSDNPGVMKDVNEIRSRVLAGYAFSQMRDVLDHRAALIGGIDDPDERRKMERRSQLEALVEIPRIVSRAEEKPITSQELENLSRLQESMSGTHGVVDPPPE